MKMNKPNQDINVKSKNVAKNKKAQYYGYNRKQNNLPFVTIPIGGAIFLYGCRWPHQDSCPLKHRKQSAADNCQLSYLLLLESKKRILDQRESNVKNGEENEVKKPQESSIINKATVNKSTAIIGQVDKAQAKQIQQAKKTNKPKEAKKRPVIKTSIINYDNSEMKIVKEVKIVNGVEIVNTKGTEEAFSTPLLEMLESRYETDCYVSQHLNSLRMFGESVIRVNSVPAGFNIHELNRFFDNASLQPEQIVIARKDNQPHSVMMIVLSSNSPDMKKILEKHKHRISNKTILYAQKTNMKELEGFLRKNQKQIMMFPPFANFQSDSESFRSVRSLIIPDNETIERQPTFQDIRFPDFHIKVHDWLENREHYSLFY